MLKLSKHHYLSLPHLEFALSHPMQLAPVRDDGDELTQAIVQDPVEHDNDWELSERPDTQELEKYWVQVEEDVRNDPEWVTLSKD